MKNLRPQIFRAGILGEHSSIRYLLTEQLLDFFLRDSVRLRIVVQGGHQFSQSTPRAWRSDGPFDQPAHVGAPVDSNPLRQLVQPIE